MTAEAGSVGGHGTSPELGRPPLAGVRVLELASIVAGPSVGQSLGDLGADVVKVEPPAGDGLRSWPPVVGGPTGSYSLNFAVINRGKRSVMLDLKQRPDREAFLRLAHQADVIVDNLRPGALERMDVSRDAIVRVCPRLIWCSVTGFGQTGPQADHGAYDVVIQGYTGMMSVTGDAEGPPVKCGVPVGDFVAGLYAALTIAAALRRREVTGEGAVLDCSMLASLLSISALQVSQYLGTGVEPGRLGSAHPRNAPYQSFQCRDAYITVAAGNDELWRRFCHVVERTDLIEDTRFASQALRATHQTELLAEVAPLFLRHEAELWLALFANAGIPCGPVNSIGQALEEKQVRHLNLVRDIALPNGGATKALSYPVLTEGWTCELAPPPNLGQHTSEVLDEWR